MESTKIEVKEHPNYRTINVNGVYGSHRPQYFEVILYSEEVDAKDVLASPENPQIRPTVKRTLETRLVINPFTAKSILYWLNQNVAEYERLFGRIPSPEEVNSKYGGGSSDNSNLTDLR